MWLWIELNFRSILVIFVIVIIASTSYDMAKQGHLSTLNQKGEMYILLYK